MRRPCARVCICPIYSSSLQNMYWSEIYVERFVELNIFETHSVSRDCNQASAKYRQNKIIVWRKMRAIWLSLCEFEHTRHAEAERETKAYVSIYLYCDWLRR